MLPNNTLLAGVPLKIAQQVLIILHGRGADAASIIPLAHELAIRDKTAILAPQAPGFAWYPQSFIAPWQSNQPHFLNSILQLEKVQLELEKLGFEKEKQIWAGFSQGGCLALEYVVRHSGPYLGVAGFSAGLIGPPGAEWPYPGSLKNVPVYLGSSDPDPHIPKWRFEETVQEFQKRDANLIWELIPNMGHTIQESQIQKAKSVLSLM